MGTADLTYVANGSDQPHSHRSTTCDVVLIRRTFMLSKRSTAMAAYECTTLLSELSAWTTCGNTAMASALLISDRKVVRYLSASALRIGFCSANPGFQDRVRVMTKMEWSRETA